MRVEKNCGLFIAGRRVLASVASSLQRSRIIGSPARKGLQVSTGRVDYVHLEGTPANVGYQHGYLLSAEIRDAFEAIKLFDTHQASVTGSSTARRRSRCFGRTLTRSIGRSCRASPMASKLKASISTSRISSRSMPSKKCPTTTYLG